MTLPRPGVAAENESQAHPTHHDDEEELGGRPTEPSGDTPPRKRPAPEAPRPQPRKLEAHKLTQQQRSHMVVGTLNVNSISSYGKPSMAKLTELVEFAKAKGMEVLFVQDHRLQVVDGGLGVLSIGEWTFQYAGCMLHGETPGGGVGVIYGPTVAAALKTVKAHGLGILQVTLCGNPKSHLFTTYCPTATNPGDQQAHLHKLLGVVNDIPAREPFGLFGDFNAVLKPKDSGRFGFTGNLGTDREKARGRLVEFLQATQLEALDTLNSIPKYYTFVGPPNAAGHRNRVPLDHVLARRAVSRSSGVPKRIRGPVPTDHFCVMCSLDLLVLRMEPPTRAKVKPKLDFKPFFATWPKDKPNPVRDKFKELLAARVENNNITIVGYEAFAKEVVKIATEALEVRRLERPKATTNQATVKEARAAFAEVDPEDPKSLRRAFQLIVAARKEAANNEVEKFCSIYEKQLARDPLRAFAAIKDISRAAMSKKKVEASSIEARLRKIAGKCKEQLSNRLGDRDIQFPFRCEEGVGAEFKTGPFDEEELVAALKETKRNKAPGVDELSTDMLKISYLRPYLLSLFNDALAKGKNPDLFRLTKFIMLAKAGADHTLPEGWRYIALMSACAKLYDKLLLNRIRKIVDPRLRINQNGFRQGRNTIQHVLALRTVIESLKQLKEGTSIQVFIDFKNAFPSVRWEAIEATLKAWRVPAELITAVLSMYLDHTAYVQTEDGDTPTFSPTAGVLQGDTLAPYLFVLVLDVVMHNALGQVQDKGVQFDSLVGQQSLTDLDFADDIVLLTTTMDDARELLRIVEAAALRVGLELNAKKTKYIVTGPVPRPNPQLVTRNGPIDEVDSYQYLGVWTDVDKDIGVRIGKGWAQMRRLHKCWKSKTLTTMSKMRLFRTFVEPTLLYGAPTYPWTQGRMDRLRGTMTRMIRMAKNLPFDLHMSVKDLYSMRMGAPTGGSPVGPAGPPQADNFADMFLAAPDFVAAPAAGAGDDAQGKQIPFPHILGLQRQVKATLTLMRRAPQPAMPVLLAAFPGTRRKGGNTMTLRTNLLMLDITKQRLLAARTNIEEYGGILRDSAKRLADLTTATEERISKLAAEHSTREALHAIIDEASHFLNEDDAPIAHNPLLRIRGTRSIKTKREELEKHLPSAVAEYDSGKDAIENKRPRLEHDKPAAHRYIAKVHCGPEVATIAMCRPSTRLMYTETFAVNDPLVAQLRAMNHILGTCSPKNPVTIHCDFQAPGQDNQSIIAALVLHQQNSVAATQAERTLHTHLADILRERDKNNIRTAILPYPTAESTATAVTETILDEATKGHTATNEATQGRLRHIWPPLPQPRRKHPQQPAAT